MCPTTLHEDSSSGVEADVTCATHDNADHPRLGGIFISTRFLRFGFVGILSGAIYAGVTSGLVWADIATATPASVLGYLAAIPLNFVGQRSFAFGSISDFRPQLVRFLITNAFNIALSGIIMLVTTTFLGAHLVWGILFTIATIPFMTFFVLEKWVFRSSEEKH